MSKNAGRFSNVFRARFPNQVCNHFDKYIMFTHPLTFDPHEVAYLPAWPDEEWKAWETLEKSKHANEALSKGNQFKVVLNKDSQSSWSRPSITFYHPEGRNLPSLDINLDDLPLESREIVFNWASKLSAYRKLRSALWGLVQSILDWGWEDSKVFRAGGGWDGRGSWVGAPTSGMGCNTVGQVKRIWPELVMFFPDDMQQSLRQASAKSRLPKYIRDWGEPEVFMLEKRPAHSVEYDEAEGEVTYGKPYSDEEWAEAKRVREAINHILIQMSLMKDVRPVSRYPFL